MYREYLRKIEKGEVEMCELCWQTPCASRCPNAEPNTETGMPPYYCSDCGSPMYAGDRAYELQGEIYCEACVEDSAFYVDPL